MPQIAVLTGDIVNSSALSLKELDLALETLNLATKCFSDWPTESPPLTTAFARRGGDSWQTILETPKLALRAALFLRATLMGAGPFQTRIAIATGEGSLTDKAMKDPNYGHGPAFTHSGRLLEKLPRNSLMQHADGGPLSAAYLLADHISREWTQAQAATMALALAPTRRTQQDIAEHLGISRQAVAQSLKSAGYTAINAALELIETAPPERHHDA
ncbi:MarR family transcriptional regulator [Aliiroseovarius crassostreae]|uniref:MarR family transcriptional regulator n=1 Tax=Aliiroseovarius crassostreae TaxID=154981 RepID=UPI00220122B5|nr:MarR family transcriptional regulator [Aliiroseovarius crassostreae]UWQ03622.1 MarR family transcriptional regulator [Aliiroseovarius crassostreae]